MATVLVVDDDPGTRQLYSSLLGHFGHQVLEAGDGRVGLRMAKERKPDLIVSDILMPTMNGYDFVSSVRKLPGHEKTNVIFQSASFLDHESRALGSSCGVQHYLSKPCDPEKILETVNRVLGLPSAQAPELQAADERKDPVSLLVNTVYEKGQQFDALAARLSAVVEFGIQASQLTSEPELLEAGLCTARKIIGASYAGGGFATPDGKGGDAQLFSPFRVAGIEPKDLLRIRKQTLGTVFQEIFDRGENVRVDGRSDNCGLCLPDAHPRVRSFLGVPVMASTNKYGMLYVADKLVGEFTAKDERMLGTIAARVAIGYENILREKNLQVQMLRLERAVRERKQAEDRFRLLVESSPMGILLCDSEGCITEANPQLQKMFGYSREELVGSPVEMLVPEAQRSAHAGHRAHYACAPQTRPMGMGRELYARRKDGTTFPVEISLGPLVGIEKPMISSTVIDITERKKLEEQLRVSQRLEAVGQLAAGIAHDFNNILTAISGNTKLAVAELPTGHAVQQNLEEIGKAATRATKLVRQVLSFSRQDPAKREVIGIANVVDEAVKLVRAGIRANISIETDYAADLPPILADSTQIHQIVMNLATNAADAIGDRQGRLKVQIAKVELGAADAASHPGLNPGCYICLSLSDNGCGMDDCTAKRVFEPFFTTKAKGHGTGLGLSVVHGIVEQHGGAIVVESELNQGTTFSLYLPVTEEVAAVGTRQSRNEIPRGDGENILYIDDEEPLVFLATRMLERMGYQVTGCTDPEKALMMFRANPLQFDAVISDLSMPGMTGTDLASTLLQIRPGIPILLTSGYIRPQDRERVRELGLHDLILKPDTIEELGGILHSLLRDSTNSHSLPTREARQAATTAN